MGRGFQNDKSDTKLQKYENETCTIRDSRNLFEND